MENGHQLKVEILGLARVPEPRANRANFTILAYFDCAIGPIILNGCAFVRTPNNSLAIWPPKADGPRAAIRSVTITDNSLRHAVLCRAQETYRLMGGTDAEWMPRETAQTVANVASVAGV